MDTSRFRAVLLLALVFAAGGLLGLAAGRLSQPATAGGDGVEEVTGGGRPESGARGGDRRGGGGRTAIEEFADELGLTANQRSQIEGFLDHYREAVGNLRRDVRPQYAALMDSVLVQIESVLTEEQVEAYREHRRQRYGSGRSDGDDGGRSEGDGRGGADGRGEDDGRGGADGRGENDGGGEGRGDR